ncbi:hypothetical protein TCAL_15363 [Tigriopus californicus]|uniref:Uncharacterized protein n=1 Tax=Tigriopus californicus TaxID=6832 RepID=A0A553PMI9_TIGCA|nr:hypothetical protein TCAL_15363 [Tigriopus californicus]
MGLLRPLLSPRAGFRAFEETKTKSISLPILATWTQPSQTCCRRTGHARVVWDVLLQEDEESLWRLIEYGSLNITENNA